jgi:hypothetical protein
MTHLTLIEHHPRAVLEAFRRGEFDSFEWLGEADEKEFFELLFREKMLLALAESMPSARQKHEVPLWFILAANFSLKLHQQNSFLAWERVVRGGGLLRAMPPELASKRLDSQSQAFVLECQGFNRKNHYNRRAPCDQDTLRKALKDVPATAWLGWFNGPIQSVFQARGFFDPEGIFLGDASYLFVPDNEAYEGSSVLWMDEHNHPVDYDTLDAEARKRVRRRRGYKWVSLLHLRGRPRCSVYAAVAVVAGAAHECPLFYGLVDAFVARLGPGVMRKLILDRGFVDGERISHCQRDLGIDVIIPMKKKMDIWEDAWALGRTQPWQPWSSPKPPPAPAPANRPEVLRRREAARQRTLAKNKALEPPPEASKQHVGTELCAIRDFRSGSAASVPIHVVLVRERYAGGHTEEWGLMSTGDFAQAGALREDYGLRTQIEERHRLIKCFYDLTDFRSRAFAAVTAQVVFVLLAYPLRQWQLWQWQQERLAGLSPQAMREELNVRRESVVIYHQQSYAQMPLVSVSRELVQLEGEGRGKALGKITEMEQQRFEPPNNPRPR